MYARALSIISPADVTAIFTTNTAFVYVGSWIWLDEKLVLLPAKVSIRVIARTFLVLDGICANFS